MAKSTSKNYTLPVIPYGTRPKVLLVGNGINLSFPGALSTDSIIQHEWSKNYGTDLPGKDVKGKVPDIWNLPFPLQVVAASKDHVQGCMDELAQSFRKQVVSGEQKAFINTILSTGFDTVLTTNYSLEFEKSAIKDYSERKVYSHYRITKKQSAQQQQFGIFQCTELDDENHSTLWHIHGTSLRKESMIMGQFFYGKLLLEIIDRANKVNKVYKSFEKTKTPFQPKSWIDYFLIGDVYIMGFQLDFSESDLWWLLSYKKSVCPDSRTYLYLPQISKEKKLMADSYGIETPYVQFKKNGFVEYYTKACRSIKA